MSNSSVNSNPSASNDLPKIIALVTRAHHHTKNPSITMLVSKESNPSIIAPYSPQAIPTLALYQEQTLVQSPRVANPSTKLHKPNPSAMLREKP